MDRQEIEMLEEVALRNAIAMFRAKLAAKGKKASIPELGIFWIGEGGTMFAESVTLRDAVNYGDFRIFEGAHFKLWNKAVRANPKWEGLEYEKVPRGRVVYRKDPKKPEFVIYMPKRLVKYKNKVADRFNLPIEHIRIDTSDEHYQLRTRDTGILS